MVCLSVYIFSSFLCNSVQIKLVKVVWDRLLVEGTIAFIKTGLIILTNFEEEIMKTTEFCMYIV